MVKNNLLHVPEIGKEYHFWDDGKTSSSRHYICRVERILTPEEANNINVIRPTIEYTKDTPVYEEVSLIDVWKEEVEECDWLYAPETDYFVEASCPKYDDNNLWFVRTVDGGWFSIDVQSGWQSGRLDVTGEIFDNVINDIIKYNPETKEERIASYYNETY